MQALATTLIALVVTASPADDEPARVSAAALDERDVRVHTVESPFQAGPTKIRVVLPTDVDAGQRYPVVYVLPVEPGDETHYGDGLAEVRKRGLPDRHRAIFVAPTFSQLPWYADHPSDPAIRQESHLLKVVLPFVEKTYPARATREGRLLLGFSKSGWGAWALLLRHPDVFQSAAAWDAPLAMDRAGRFGSGPIFGTQQNFQAYSVFDLLRARKSDLTERPRLILLGRGNFVDDLERTHALLDELEIPHAYRAGPTRKHDWHSGWVSEAVELLVPAAGERR